MNIFARYGDSRLNGGVVLIGFSDFLYKVTDGDTLATNGSVALSKMIELPLPGDKLPGLDDLVNGEPGVVQSLDRLYSTSGGIRSTIGGNR
jgi:hypothetical protein